MFVLVLNCFGKILMCWEKISCLILLKQIYTVCLSLLNRIDTSLSCIYSSTSSVKLPETNV